VADVHHKHGKPKGNAQVGAVQIIGAQADAPVGAKTVRRADVAALKTHSGARNQTSSLDAGNRGPDRRGGAYKGRDKGGK
jgi:hypothetical protein